ncbi:MAG: MarR family EPS-associated transcriptional regulator [Sulfurimonas sp.]
MADELGYSMGKINYVIRALIEKGMLKSEKFINSQNKLQYKYLLTEDGIKEKIALTEKFVKTKKAEYDQLRRELEILKGGVYN